MNHRDAEMAEVTIVLDKAYEDRLTDAVSDLKSAGLNVSDADDDNSVVIGTCPTSILAQLKALPCVDYIRTNLTWIADYPPGDPRDTDGPEDLDLDPDVV